MQQDAYNPFRPRLSFSQSRAGNTLCTERYMREYRAAVSLLRGGDMGLGFQIGNLWGILRVRPGELQTPKGRD